MQSDGKATRHTRMEDATLVKCPNCEREWMHGRCNLCKNTRKVPLSLRIEYILTARTDRSGKKYYFNMEGTIEEIRERHGLEP